MVSINCNGRVFFFCKEEYIAFLVKKTSQFLVIKSFKIWLLGKMHVWIHIQRTKPLSLY